MGCRTATRLVPANSFAAHNTFANNKKGNMKPSESPISQLPRKFKEPQEYKVIALRDCPLPENMHLCDTPEQAVEYWKIHVTKNPYYDPERECFVVLMLNTRRRVRGHQLVSIGTLDTVLVHPRDVFRVAVIANASALVLLHNHPSGEPEPSQADIKITRDLIRAGQLMKIEILDHIIIGAQRHCSTRAQGYFY